MDRRLAAILAADMVGFSRLVAADESGTLERLKRLRREIIDPAIAAGGGKIVKLTGDGMLVLFGSVVAAVESAVAVQRAVAAAEVDTPADTRIVFRIGLHLGDVILDEGDVYGDGVNIAARLEAAAEPGGVTISDDAYRQLRGKTALDFVDIGELRLKNIPHPVRAHRLSGAKALSTSVRAGHPDGPPLPPKPSIAVLPFREFGGDPERDFFADGLTDEIITTLSKIDRLFVVAHSSTQGYRDRAVDLGRVGREQGVRYVLEGTVRRASDRVRVTAHLTDVASGQQIWGERFDRGLDDFFAVQDELTREVAVNLQVQLTEGDQARIRAGGTNDLRAWELTMRGADLVNRHVRDDNLRAHGVLEEAVRIDPRYVDAWCQLGWCHWCDGRHLWSPDAAASLARAREIGEHAVRLDPDAAEPHALLALTAMQLGEFDEAASRAAAAAERAGGHSFVLAIASMVNTSCGRAAEAVTQMRLAMRLSPIHPNWYRMVYARGAFLVRDYEACLDTLQDWSSYYEGTFAFPVTLIAALVEMGREGEARRIASEALHAEPHFTISQWRQQVPQGDPEDLGRFIAPMRSLGLPE